MSGGIEESDFVINVQYNKITNIHIETTKKGGGGEVQSVRYIVYHLTEKSNKESVLDKPHISETKRKEVPQGRW